MAIHPPHGEAALAALRIEASVLQPTQPVGNAAGYCVVRKQRRDIVIVHENRAFHGAHVPHPDLHQCAVLTLGAVPSSSDGASHGAAAKARIDGGVSLASVAPISTRLSGP